MNSHLRPAATALAAALACAFLVACGEAPGGAPPAATGVPQVGIVTLQAQRLALNTELPGRVASTVSAEVRPEVSGIVQQRLFVEGSNVKAGQLLYQIDPASARAAVASAEATLAKAEATLASAQLKATRNRELVAIQAVSRQDADDAEAALMQAQADLAQTPIELYPGAHATALGAAAAARLALDPTLSVESAVGAWQPERVYTPDWSADRAATFLSAWERALTSGLSDREPA